MQIKSETITVTTASDGTATAYFPAISGKLLTLAYIKTDYTDGVDFTITVEGTGQNIWVDTNVNASEVVNPRMPVHDTTGAACLHAAGGTGLCDHIRLANDRVKVVLAQGGSVKTGQFRILYE